MATFTTTVPDAAVNDLVKALAQRMGVAEPTTAAGKAALAEQFTKQELFRLYVDWKAQQAAQQARDQAAGW